MHFRLLPTLSLVLVVIGSAFPALAEAQSDPSLPLCPASEETLSTEAPEVIRRGLSYSVKAYGAPEVKDATLNATFTPANDRLETTSEAFPIAGDAGTLIRASPLKNGMLALEFSWTENAGTPAACRAYDRYGAIPVVSPRAKIGDVEAPRIAGRYRARYAKTTPATWTLRPRCDVFGCSTEVRSSGGFRTTLTWDASLKAYVGSRRDRDGYCDVVYGDGRRARWTVFIYTTVTLRPRRFSTTGRATLLVGSRKSEVDAPSDPAGACVTSSRTYERLTLRAISN